MGGHPRIPQSIPEFNTFIRSTDDYQLQTITPRINPNWQVLGWASADSTQWTAYRTEWETQYIKYSNVGQRTKVVVEDIRNLMDNFRAFAQPLLDIISASPNAIERDALEFNLVLQSMRKDPTHRTTPIADDMFGVMVNKQGCEVDVTCRTVSDASRASLPQAADSVRIALKIGDQPTSPNDGCTFQVHTKAKFTLNPGIEFRGRPVFVYAQWYNTKHPELAGGWVQLQNVVLS